MAQAPASTKKTAKAPVKTATKPAVSSAPKAASAKIVTPKAPTPKRTTKIANKPFAQGTGRRNRKVTAKNPGPDLKAFPRGKFGLDCIQNRSSHRKVINISSSQNRICKTIKNKGFHQQKPRSALGFRSGLDSGGDALT